MNEDEERGPCYRCRRRDDCSSDDEQHCALLAAHRHAANRSTVLVDALPVEEHPDEFNREARN